jgi:DNA invertase Pin-like site-specific DNA recombinase
MEGGDGGWLLEKVQPWHRDRLAVVYVRQSTAQQVLDHQESTRLQYGLTTRAVELGWAEARVLVIDDDLGKSGTSTEGRVGFQRLVSEGSLDRVGLILGVEMSRLARSCTDWYRLLWYRLLELCALFRTLIADLDGIYDPAQYNDRLLLGLKGTIAQGAPGGRTAHHAAADAPGVAGQGAPRGPGAGAAHGLRAARVG